MAGELRQVMVQVNDLTWSHQRGINRGATGALWLSGQNSNSFGTWCPPFLVVRHHVGTATHDLTLLKTQVGEERGRI